MRAATSLCLARLCLMLTPCFLFLSGCTDLLVNRFSFFPQTLGASFSPPLDPRVQELYFDAPDGTRLHALFLRHPESRRAVLFLHGNAGHVYHRVDAALALYDRGASVLLLSYRGYGKSAGSPSEAGVYADAQAALDLLHGPLGFSAAQTFILGRSLGSAVAVEVAQQRKLAGLILVTPLSSGRDVARYRGLGWAAGWIGHPFDSVRKVAALNLPALFIHGNADWVIPLDHGRRLFEAYPGPHKSFVVVQNAGHLNVIQVAGARYWDWIEAFLDRHAPA